MAKKYRCLIIDDEQPARVLLSNYISRVDFLEEVGSFKGLLSAANIIEKKEFDILFLDIQMNEFNGLEFLRIKNLEMPIILTTAYKEFAIDAFELNVFDYLLKPFSFERFYSSVNKIIARTPAFEFTADYISIQTNRKLIKLALNDILFIESDSEYVHFYTTNQKKIMVKDSLKNLECQLPSNFYRIHKSYIVSIDKVTEQEGNFVRIKHYEIPIARANKKQALKLIFGK